jgi:hypothetical protein
MPGRYVQLVATKLCRIAIDLAGDRMLISVGLMAHASCRCPTGSAGFRVWIVTLGAQLGQLGQAAVGVLGKRLGVGYIRRNTPYALNKAPLWICT